MAFAASISYLNDTFSLVFFLLERFVALAYIVALLGDRQPSSASSSSATSSKRPVVVRQWSDDQWSQVCATGLGGLQDEVHIE
jgi:hypothetical protein